MESGKAIRKRLGGEIGRAEIVEAALAVADEQGLHRCDYITIGDRLGLDDAALRQHFPNRADLLAAMGERAADASSVSGAGESWRDQLMQRAIAMRHAMLSRRDGGMLFMHLPLPFPSGRSGIDTVPSLCSAGFTLSDARSAVMLVDRFTLGWVLIEQAQPDAAELQTGFESQLGVVVAGVAASLGAGLAIPHDDRRSRFQSSLWVFLRDARESANIAFSRTAQLNELDRRILLLLQAQGDMTLAAISTSNGVDKAQVSRAIKRLDEIALVSRTSIRSPIRLSQTGRQLAERLLRQAELRNRELAFGITDDQLVSLFGVLDTLLSRAVTLFEQERRLTATSQKGEQVDFQDLVDDGLPGENGIAVDRSRILPPFITLCSYMLRGGALAHKRRTGLSNFESWVLVEVCRDPPISWPQLVIALSRDQSQAGRTVNHLIDIGLVERTGRPGRRHGFFGPTEEGRRICEIINETAVKRSEFLFQGIAASQLEAFMSAFAVLTRNAEVQLAREKAIEEMDRD